MPRGQRNYYDPILQVPSTVEGAPDLSRIELFPIGQDSTSRLPADVGKWMARRINPDGSIAEYTPGDFNHDGALQQAQDAWPELTVFELTSEIEDSTWEGTGPSPRLWQTPGNAVPPATAHKTVDQIHPFPPVSAIERGGTRVEFAPHDSPPVIYDPVSAAITAGEEMDRDAELTPAGEAPQLHAMQVDQPGVYVSLEDILVILEHYAVQFDSENNPSAALGLREAAKALREGF
jgi:hypothetical protein